MKNRTAFIVFSILGLVGAVTGTVGYVMRDREATKLEENIEIIEQAKRKALSDPDDFIRKLSADHAVTMEEYNSKYLKGIASYTTVMAGGNGMAGISILFFVIYFAVKAGSRE